MKELHLWNFIHDHLTQNNSVALVAVVAHEEGSQGKEGFKMAVSSKDGSVGSIGGGVMEYNIIKNLKNLLRKNISTNKIEKLFHNRKSSVNKSGLICAGSQTNFTISFTIKDIDKVKRILDFIKEHKPGKIIFSQNGVSFVKKKKNSKPFVFYFKSENDWIYEETIGLKNTVYVVGGGHVGLAISKIMSMLDFYVIVYDDRKDLTTLSENIYANKKIIDSYKNVGKIVEEGNESFVVIVTTGFESDKEALKQIINKNIRYIGLMGTKVKIKKIFNEAIKDGVKKELLKKVHAPIGLDINSDTPEEIAVSIAAEIIREKSV